MQSEEFLACNACIGSLTSLTMCADSLTPQHVGLDASMPFFTTDPERHPKVTYLHFADSPQFSVMNTLHSVGSESCKCFRCLTTPIEWIILCIFCSLVSSACRSRLSFPSITILGWPSSARSSLARCTLSPMTGWKLPLVAVKSRECQMVSSTIFFSC